LEVPNAVEIGQEVAQSHQPKRYRDSAGYDTDDNVTDNKYRNNRPRVINSPRLSNSMSANLVSEVNDIITPYDYSTGFPDFLEYYVDRLPLLYDNQLEVVSEYSTDDSQLESVESHDWNREYANSLYYQSQYRLLDSH